MDEKPTNLSDLVDEFREYISQLSLTLIQDIPKEIREANKHYLAIINLAGELNGRLNRF